MSYLVNMFSTFFTLTNKVKIPIPLTTTYVVQLPLFSLIYFGIVFGILSLIFKKFIDVGEGFGNYVINHEMRSAYLKNKVSSSADNSADGKKKYEGVYYRKKVGK